MTHNLFLRKFVWKVRSTGQKGKKDSKYPEYRTKKLKPHPQWPQPSLSLSLTTKQFPADGKADYPWSADFPYFYFAFDLHVPHWPVL
jgi:hypothetical protein